MKTKTAVFAAVFCLCMSAVVFGQDEGFGPPCPDGPPPFDEGDEARGAKRHEKMMAELHRDIGLSEEQDTQLRAMRRDEMQNVRGLHRELRFKQEQMRLELDKYNSDMDKISKLIKEIEAAHSALVKNRVEAITQLKKVLTEDQFNLLVQKMRIHMEVRKQLRHRQKAAFRPEAGKGGDDAGL